LPQWRKRKRRLIEKNLAIWSYLGAGNVGSPDFGGTDVALAPRLALDAGDGVGEMWRALKIAWRIAWGIIELAVVLYVLGAIKDRSTGIVVSVLGLIYATIRVLSLNLGHAFVLLGHGLEQRFYCMSSEHFGQLAGQFKRVSGSSGLKVQAAIAC
jgi:hypothetical protein